MGFSDKFKKVTERAQQLAGQAADELQEAAETAKNKTAELAGENRERIGSAIDKTAAVVSERTGDKYADKIDSARTKAHEGLDKVADAGEPPAVENPENAADPSVSDPPPDVLPDPLPPVEPIPDPEPLPGS